MPRFVLILGCLCIFWSAQVAASTYRIQFDVVTSEIGYLGLGNLTENRRVDPTSQEYAAFTAEFHSLGAALGQTGPVTLELDLDVPYNNNNRDPEYGYLGCISGFLCSTNGLFVYGYKGIVEVHDFEYPDNIVFDGYCCDEWRFDGGLSLNFFDDTIYRGSDIFRGDIYDWEHPYATFTLANVTTTKLAPVPLPASAPVLAAGVLFLGAVRMRRRGRRG